MVIRIQLLEMLWDRVLLLRLQIEVCVDDVNEMLVSAGNPPGGEESGEDRRGVILGGNENQTRSTGGKHKLRLNARQMW
jgi:hypothetical protein